MKSINALLVTTLLLVTGMSCQQTTDTSEAAAMPATAAPGAQADPAEMVKYGGYLVRIMGCNDCHTPLKMTPQGPAPDMDRMLSGHPAEVPLPPVDPAVGKDYVLFNMTNTGVIGPWGTSYSANLTPDETGIGSWTEEQFIRALKEGKSKGLENGRPLLPPMPWQNYIDIKDEDVKAIFAYLKSIKPIRNQVPAPVFAAAPPQ